MPDRSALLPNVEYNQREETMLLTPMDPTQNVTLDIKLGPTGENLTIDYVTPNSNQPNTFGNQVYLWQAGSTVPWGTPPRQHQGIDGTTRQGSLIFNDLNMGSKSYIIGYSVGDEVTSWVKYGNVCATAFLPEGIITDPDPSKIDYFSTKISPQVSGDTIDVGYQVTPGVQPKTNGAWMALWRTKTNPYLNPNYDHAIPISKDADSSSERFNDITLIAGVTYTLALVMSGWDTTASKGTCQTAISAVTTFKME